MQMGLVVLVTVLAVTGVLGVLRTQRDGTMRAAGRRSRRDDGSVAPLDEATLGQPLGERATLLQFSTAFCAPCRVTRAVLSDVAAGEPGVRHIELDAESHLDLVRRLGIARTPTVLVLDGDGREVGRATGAPRKPQVLEALAALPDQARPGPDGGRVR
jgi:thiol-disulfide isomerase/thioredoxin